jgi:hypothetical protein
MLDEPLETLQHSTASRQHAIITTDKAHRSYSEIRVFSEHSFYANLYAIVGKQDHARPR